MSYIEFIQDIKQEVKTIFELGSRDIKDAIILSNKYPNAKIYSFECNPDCLKECRKNLTREFEDKITLVEKAVCIENGETTFYPFDLTKYDNMGASSMYMIDFTKRDANDDDYCRAPVQKEIKVKATRLDTYLEENDIGNIDLLCMDLQGYELNALKSLGSQIKNVKYIITECSINSTYTGGVGFYELYNFLKENGFEYVRSNLFGYKMPIRNSVGFCEFDALFSQTNIR